MHTATLGMTGFSGGNHLILQDCVEACWADSHVSEALGIFNSLIRLMADHCYSKY